MSGSETEIASAGCASPSREDSLASHHVELAKEEIICPMCIGVFDNPRSLQCLHSYCEKCLLGLHRASAINDSIDCPECRAQTAVPEEGIQGLPLNFKLQRFVDILSTEEKADIVQSATLHSEPNSQEPIDLKCRMHASKPLEYYCEECEVLACGQCMLNAHRLHKDVKFASDALPEHISALSTMLSPTDTVIPKAEQALESLQCDAATIRRTGEDTASHVRSYFSNIQHILTERERLILDGIEAEVTDKEKVLSKKQQSIREATGEIQECKTIIQDISETRQDDIRILLEEQNLKIRVKTHLIHLESILGKIKHQGRLSFQKPFELNHVFEGQCKHLGEMKNRPFLPSSSSSESLESVSAAQIRRRSAEEAGASPKKKLSKTKSADVNTYPMLETSLDSTYQTSSFRPRSQSFFEDIPEAVILQPFLEIGPKQLLGSPPRSASVYPCGVCIGKPDCLIVTDSRNHMFSILTPTGKCLESIDTEKKSDGQFMEPTAVATDEDGNILMVDKGTTCRIQRYSPSGKYLGKIRARAHALTSGNHMGEPTGIVVLDDGTLLVTDAEKSCIHVFDGTSKYQGKLETTEARRPKNPAGIAYNRGNLIITDRGSHCVLVYTINGRYLYRFGKQGSEPGELLYPCGVTTDKEGNIFVSESGNHRISVFTAGGKFVKTFGTKGSEPGMFLYPRHVCMDSQGRLVVADEYNQRVQIFDIKDFIQRSVV